MALIRLLKVPKSAIDPNRPINALLRAQVMHLREAERMLPTKYHSDVYVNAIRTESEASEYIAAVTDAIHKAHEEAVVGRVRRLPRRGRKIATAGAGGKPQRKPQRKARARKMKRQK